jgi:hypothetical protein
LRAILHLVCAEDMSMLAELILRLRPDIQTQTVDWLAWEDPFIFERDASALKAQRERSETEFAKRIGYVAPMLALLYAAANESGNFRPTNSA